ncbi:MAG: hypothetical protein ACYDCO_28015 [Armatimonadota bacterium]
MSLSVTTQPELPPGLCFVLVGVAAPRAPRPPAAAVRRPPPPGHPRRRSTVTALPPPRRETRCARLRAIAERDHLALRVCACKNPDIAGERCQIAGRWGAQAEEAQLRLY